MLPRIVFIDVRNEFIDLVFKQGNQVLQNVEAERGIEDFSMNFPNVGWKEVNKGG